MAARALVSGHLSSALAALLFCVACGGGGSGGSPPTTAAPSPIATATPIPSPSPSPSPSPLPSPSLPRLIGAAPGEQLVGVMACATDETIHDSLGRLTGMRSLTGAKIDNLLGLTYRGVDSYALDVNGFGGSSFAPTDKRVSSNAAYDQFANPTQGELFILRNGGQAGTRTFTTLGLDNSAGLCFFALGRRADGLPQYPDDEHVLTVDGIARQGDQLLRLFGSGGTMRVNIQTREVALTLRISGRSEPFGDFAGRDPREITTATANLSYNGGGSFPLTVLRTGNGYAGSITGFFTTPGADAVGAGGAGAVLTFELRNAQGDIILGAVASETNRI